MLDSDIPQEPAPEPPADEAPPGAPAFPLVGVGVGAGGLAALQAFIAHTPAESGMALVVIVHPAPALDQPLAALLQPLTGAPVVTVERPLPLAPGRIFLAPPGQQLILRDGVLHPAPPAVSDRRLAPVDRLFRALADHAAARAAAVVLAGAGGDGALGLLRIKEVGGLVLAQDPREAAADTMPRTAIASGLVDLVRPAAALPEALVAYWRALQRSGGVRPAFLRSDADNAALRDILAVLRVRSGHDFSAYKGATVQRRVRRRMHICGADTLPDYLRLLSAQPEEAAALLRDLLISVTSFFRDPPAWQALRAVLPRLFLGKRPGDHVRVWVAGCATGEEAYSVAMLLLEHARTLDDPPAIQVFATDINADAIARARQGCYPLSIAADLPPACLERFFWREGQHYRVTEQLRELVLFAAHNLLRDAPFSRLDLVSCRNLLIYLDPQMQRQVLALFHFTLQTDGYLLLGSSERAEAMSQQFAPVDVVQRLYQRRSAPPALPLSTPALSLPGLARARQAEPAARTGGQDRSLDELSLRLLARHGPSSVIVDETFGVLHLGHGADRFLQLHAGEPSYQLLQLIHPSLRPALHTALLAALERGARSEAGGLPMQLEGGTRLVTIVVQPISDPAWARGALLVLFYDLGLASLAGQRPADDSAALVRQLGDDLLRTKAELQLKVEQYEALVEEYKAANEELQVVNEELQSSKEELQTLNEELLTVNGELRAKVAEVSQANTDLQNLMAATAVATLFVDRQLQIRRYTPAALAIFNLIPADQGRPLAHITHRLLYPALLGDARQVLLSGQPAEREVQSDQGAHYLARFQPYRVHDQGVGGVVLIFIDITERKRAEEQLRASEARFRTLTDAVPQVIWASDADGRAVYFNQRWFAYSGLSPERSAGSGWQTSLHPDDAPAALEHWRQALAAGLVFDSEYRLRRADGVYRWHIGRNVPLRDQQGQIIGWFGSATDIEDLKQSEAAVQRARDELEQRVQQRTAELTRLSATRQELLQRLVTAQEDERRRVARELHDSLGQYLSALTLDLERVQRTAGCPPAALASLARLQAMSREIDAELDRLTMELRPPALDDLGLEDALARYAQEWTAAVGIQVDLVAAGLGDARMPAAVEASAYRIVQEALTNVRKHAQARHVSVIVERRGALLRVVVEDDGVGFVPEAVRRERGGGRQLGLVGMAERANLVGGTLTVESAPGHGSVVYLSVPLAQG